MALFFRWTAAAVIIWQSFSGFDSSEKTIGPIQTQRDGRVRIGLGGFRPNGRSAKGIRAWVRSSTLSIQKEWRQFAGCQYRSRIQCFAGLCCRTDRRDRRGLRINSRGIHVTIWRHSNAGPRGGFSPMTSRSCSPDTSVISRSCLCSKRGSRHQPDPAVSAFKALPIQSLAQLSRQAGQRTLAWRHGIGFLKN